MVVGNAGGAGIGMEPFGKGLPQGMDPAAGPRTGFEDDDVVAGLGQLVTGGQPGESRADDEDLPGGACAFEPSFEWERLLGKGGERRSGEGRLLQEASAVHRLSSSQDPEPRRHLSSLGVSPSSRRGSSAGENCRPT